MLLLLWWWGRDEGKKVSEENERKKRNELAVVREKGGAAAARDEFEPNSKMNWAGIALSLTPNSDQSPDRSKLVSPGSFAMGLFHIGRRAQRERKGCRGHHSFEKRKARLPMPSRGGGRKKTLFCYARRHFSNRHRALSSFIHISIASPQCFFG